MSTTKEAQRDAREYARAEMFYGDGAGTRRKLIQATVDSRAHRDPAYARAFHEALAQQDMAEHAKKAQGERHRRDRSATVSKNVRAIARGDNRGVNASILVLGAVAYVAHQTGYDQVVYHKVKMKIRQFRNRRAAKKTVNGWLRDVSDPSPR